MKYRNILTACVTALIPLVVLGAQSARQEYGDALRSKADAAHGEELFEQCVSCHGADGGGMESGSTPRIAGQHYRVLVKQLVDFRHGKRWDFQMEPMAKQHHLAGAQDIADVAVYIAGLPPAGPSGIGSGEFAAAGSAIYRENCQSCHGAKGEGHAQRGIPRLAGQHYGYLMRQMYDAVDNRRPALPQLHSARIAPLDFEQVRAVADFLARIDAAVPEAEASRPQ